MCLRHFESSEHREELKSLDLGLITKEIEEYNKQFGWPAILARKIFPEIAPQGNSDQLEVTQGSETESQQTALKTINDKYGILLVKAGIGLEPAKGMGILVGGGEPIESSALKVNLVNSEAYISYLALLNGEQMTPSQMEGLRVVGNNLIEQVLYRYDATTEDPRMVELMKNTNNIVEHYHRLDPEGEKGLTDAVRELPLIERAYRGKYLKQYAEVHRQQLLSQVGSNNFGPSRWHIDTTRVGYRHYWDRAMTVLAELKKTPQARDLYIEVSSNLAASAAHAKQQLETVDRKEDWETIQEKLKTLEEVLRVLKKSAN